VDVLSGLTVQLLNALVLAAILFLISIGLTMIFGIMGVLNFAHGTFYMLGAYFAYTIVVTINSFWIALFIAPFVVGIVGGILEITTLRFIYERGHFYQLLLTFGFLLILEALIQIVWGPQFKQVALPTFLSGSFRILDEVYPIYRMFLLCLATVVAIGLLVLINKTKLGYIIRAVSQNAEMSGAIGINVKLVRSFVFALGCTLAGLGGVVVAPMVSASLGMGVSILIDAFVVVVIGGLGSIIGSLVGSLIVGAAKTWGTYLLPEGAMVIIYALMAFVLVFRKTGFFGEEE
jgi:branched-chain amino acid transport system permease protein